MIMDGESTNNMSGGVYISGCFLIGMGLHLWPILFWGPLGILCAVYTLVGAVWTFDTFRRWKWSLRKSLLILLAVPAVVIGVILLIPIPPSL